MIVKLTNKLIYKKSKQFHSKQVLESEVTNGEFFKAQSVKDNTVLLFEQYSVKEVTLHRVFLYIIGFILIPTRVGKKTGLTYFTF